MLSPDEVEPASPPSRGSQAILALSYSRLLQNSDLQADDGAREKGNGQHHSHGRVVMN